MSTLNSIVVAGVCSGLCFLAPFLSFSSPFLATIASWFTSLPLFIVGLSFGLLPFLQASVAALILLLLAGTDIAASYVLYNAFPSTLLVFFSLKSITTDKKLWWYPEEKLLTCLTLLSIVISLFARFKGQSHASIEKFFQKTFISDTSSIPQITRESTYYAMKLMIPLFGSIKGFTWSCITIINVYVAQRILSSKGITFIRPKLKITEIHLSTFNKLFFPLSLAVFILVPQLRYLAANAMVLASFPVFLNGWAALSFALEGKSRKFIWSICILAFLFAGPIVIIMIIGLLDGILNIRYSLKKLLTSRTN